MSLLEQQSAGRRISKCAPFSQIYKQNNKNKQSLNKIEYVNYPNNVLFVMFHMPISVSLIGIYNYSKTPSRGVKDFNIELDDRLIYVGSIPEFHNNNNNIRQPCQSIIFANHSKLIGQEKKM
jgi:hypothetical protein